MNDISLADISKMSFDDLMFLREKWNNDPAMQQLLAPFEHKAFAKRYIKDNPKSGPLIMGAAIPGYQLAKMFGMRARTKPSIDQLFAGYQGMFEGMRSMR